MDGLAAVVKIFRCSGMSLQAADASGCERNFYTAFISIKESNLSLTHQFKKHLLEEIVGVCVFSSPATRTISIRAYLRT